MSDIINERRINIEGFNWHRKALLIGVKFMKKLIIFGLDGVIADTSPGIVYCVNHSVASMGYKPIVRDALYGIISNPLTEGFRKLYSMDDDEIEYIANNYSKLYSLKGKNMHLIYEGVAESLTKLKEKGYKLAIATQKHSMFTHDILNAHDELKDLFDVVRATDVDVQQPKRDLVLQVCQELEVSVEDSILVGDTDVSALAAQDIGMDFVAVLYGWGFRTKEDAEKYNCKAFLNSATEIYEKLSKI